MTPMQISIGNILRTHKPVFPVDPNACDCPQCGQAFVRRNDKQMYCSLKCSTSAVRARAASSRDRKCVVCGGEVKKKSLTAKTCSDACQRKHRSAYNAVRYKTGEIVTTRQDRACVVCGTMFRPRAHNSLVCSHECRTAREREIYGAC